MIRFVFIICGLFVMSISVFGQDNLSKELSESFKKYDLVKIDNKVVIEKAKSEQPIEIQAYGREFTFVLTPNDLRAKNYRAIESTSSGERELERTEIITYKGKLTSDPDSEVRFTVTEENIEGFIYTGVDKFFVNQARNFSKSAQKNDVVVYGDDDLIKTVDLSDDAKTPSADVEGKMDYGLDIIKSYIYGADKMAEISDSAAAADLRTIEVDTEADYQWVTQAGGASAANNEILGILNLVDGIYERDLNLSITVNFQHAWTTADPYSAASSSALLDSFLGYWNTNYPRAQYPRDIAHLFTGKLSNQGIAYQGITCRIPDAAYGVTARSGSVNHLITAHEIGHNLGAEHVDNSGSCATSIMIPVLSGNVTGFCDVSKAQIQNYVAANGSCLTTGGTTPTPTPTPNPTPTPVTCTYSITTTNQIFSSSGGAGNVGVLASSGCSWTAVSNQSFITIVSGATGSGNGTVNYSVAVNNGVARTGTITIAGRIFTVNQAAAAAPSYEADVASRPNGDGVILSDDVVQVRRFSNGTHTADQTTSEFQRADSAPFASRGDGKILSDDVVQARRYQNGTNPKQLVGGPVAQSAGGQTTFDTIAGILSNTVSKNAVNETLREVRVESTTASAGQMMTVNIRFNAQGDEAEYGFVLSYDQTKLSNPVIGAGTAGASVRSCNIATAGQINCSLGGFPNNNPTSSDAGIGEIAAGTNQLLITVQFTVAANASVGETPLTLSNLNASSDAPQLFTPTATNGNVTILAQTANVSVSGRVLQANGRGVANARVEMTDQSGNVRTVLTNPFGYYRFAEVAVGETYIISGKHKRYEFDAQTLAVNGSLSEVNLTARE